MRKYSLLLIIVMFSGCGPSNNTMTYEIGRKDEHATLSLGGSTIIFEGIPFKGADATNLATGFFTVRGTGTSQGQSSVDVRTETGVTALMLAASGGDLDVLRTLIGAGMT